MKQNTKSFKLRLQKLSSYVLITMGLFLLAILLPPFFSTDQEGTTGLVGAIIAFGIFPVVLGVILLNNANKKIKQEIDDYNERTILTIARKNKGVMTAAEFSEQTEFNLDDATKMLNDYVVKGIAIADVTENGLIEYRFNNFIE